MTIESIPSSKEIMDRRPTVDGSAEDELRAMRDERAAREGSRRDWESQKEG